MRPEPHRRHRLFSRFGLAELQFRSAVQRGLRWLLLVGRAGQHVRRVVSALLPEQREPVGQRRPEPWVRGEGVSRIKGSEATVSASPTFVYSINQSKTSIHEKRTNPSAGFLQASILPETYLLPPKRGAHAGVKESSMQSENATYTRPITSHIRSK